MWSDISFLKKLLTTVFYYLILFPLAYLILRQFQLIEAFQYSNLEYFDALNYFKIAKDGYSETWLTAYFPLLPLVWSLFTSFSAISIFNGIIYIIAVSLISWRFKISTFVHLIYLAIPSTIFFFLPYSESLFFVSTVFLLLGLAKRNHWLIILGTLLAATTRPTIAVFIPAFWLMSLLELVVVKKGFDWKTPVIGTLSSLVGLAVVFIIQWLDTEEFFTFLEAQKLWGNEIGIPSFPFSSWGGNNIVKLDSVAFWVGIASGLIFLWNLFFKSIEIKREVVFSMLYLAGTTLLILLYRGGEFFSLNRFLFATPFFLIVLGWLSGLQKIKNWWFIPLTLFVCSLVFGAYVHIQALLKWLILIAFVTLITLGIPGQQFKKSVFLKPFILTLLITLQVYFLWRFFQGNWIA